LLFARNGVGPLGIALAKGEVFARCFVEHDLQVVRRHAGRHGDVVVDVFQECESRLLRPPCDESELEDNEIIVITHADKRGRVEKALLRQFKDKLVESSGGTPACASTPLG